MKTNTKRTLISLIPISVLVIMLALNISIFGGDSILGASQVALLVASGLCIALGMWLYKIPWSTFEQEMEGNIRSVATAIIILLFIGAISGTWTMSGVVPAFIYYGLKIISPKVFLVTACALCALVSVMTGSSWTTIATVGVALLGIGRAEGFSDAMTAGAIISGAYFGDKISPLSDTTVLAASINKVDLFDHIQYMYYTTVPSILITLVVFGVLGFTHGGAPDASMEVYSQTLSGTFHITPWLMLVPILTVILIWKKLPALVFQPEVIRTIGQGITEGSAARVSFAGIVETIYNSVSLDTGVPEVDKLVASRGMRGMLDTIFLIIVAMCFGASMYASGMITDLSRILAPLTRTRTGLVGSTVITGSMMNGIVSDQYLSIILTSNIYRSTFEKEGYENRLLSRAVEDSATVTSPLYPWSSCGMTQATILSVPTLVYAPFCLFNILSPLMSFLVGWIGWQVVRRTPSK